MTTQVQEATSGIRSTFPPYPQTERQAEFMAMADELAAITGAQAATHDVQGTFPFESFQALRERGYLALTVPEAYGGRGASPLETMLAQERLAYGNGSVALGAQFHLTICAGLADGVRTWPQPILERFYGEVVANGALVNSAASEPALGSPSRGGMYKTTAVRDGDGWRINGQKSWTTLAPGLTYALVLLSEIQADGSALRGNFLVPMQTPGVQVLDNWDNLGMRASGSNDVAFDNVWVNDDCRLPPSTEVPNTTVSRWSLLSSAVYLGIAGAARDWTVHYAQNRVPAGAPGPISELPAVQQKLAQIEVLLYSARATLYHTIEAWERCPDDREQIGWTFAAAKHLVTNNAIEITDLCLRVVGAAGMFRAHPLERYFRDVRSGLGNPPIDDIALSLVAKGATRTPPKQGG
ncbi:MAG TPA: acyl-CoA dehydrogenase family protein [Thermomicrobiales bacterium]|nr:acyl-CoA dehydrogenase family protein [Thermomicrobiales bacterium]